MTGNAQAATPTALQCQELIKTYGQGETHVTAIAGITVAIPQRSFTAIVGPSGSGKSTLMHCLAGLDTPTSGTVTIGGTTITGMTDTELTKLRRSACGFVFQSYNLVDVLTARNNILLPFQLSGATPDQARFNTVVEQMHIADRLDHLPSELSGGQQQRVALARALVMKPDVIFADEPTGALDHATGNHVLDILRAAVDHDGQTVVMVTHDPNAAARADRVLVLGDGQIQQKLVGATAAHIATTLTTRAA